MVLSRGRIGLHKVSLRSSGEVIAHWSLGQSNLATRAQRFRIPFHPSTKRVGVFTLALPISFEELDDDACLAEVMILRKKR